MNDPTFRQVYWRHGLGIPPLCRVSLFYLEPTHASQVDGLPIRVWGRYLRDTMVQALAELQNQERIEWLVPEEPGAKMEL